MKPPHYTLLMVLSVSGYTAAHEGDEAFLSRPQAQFCTRLGQLPKLLFHGCAGSYTTPTEGLYSNSSAKMFVNDKKKMQYEGYIFQQSQ